MVADVNADGAPDIVATYRDGGLEVYLNDGLGSFTLSQTVAREDFPTSRTLVRCTTADFDNDGDLDIVVSSDRWNNHFALLINDGTGHFSIGWDSPIVPSGECWVLKTGDFNNDGYSDFAAGGDHRGSNIWINNGDNTFTGAYAINGTATSWTEGVSQWAL